MKRLLLFFLVAFLTSCEMLDDYIAQLESENYDYTYIDMKDYPDWDCGIITKDDLFMFVKQDSLTNESVAYVNVKDANTDGITLYFDDCSRLSSFITERGQCYLYWNGEETADIHIITEDKNEIIENVAIPYFHYPETRVVWVPIFVNVARGLLVALTVKGAIDLTVDLATGDFKGVGTDLIEMIAGGKTGKMFTDLITGYGFEGLKWLKGNYDKKLPNCLLGDCQIQVSSNKEGINNYSITVAISGYETLPVLNSITGEKSVVIAGVVVRKSFEHVDYSTNDDTLLTFQVDGNGAKTIHFELPENSVYYVAPYLLPTRYGKYPIIGGLRHGNTIRLDCFDGYIDSFEQLSYKKENGKYTFECTAHAICNAGEDHMWMLYYMDDKKMLKTYFEAKTYSEPSIGNSNTADFDFELSISADDIKEGKKNIKLGIYAYNIGLHSDPQTFVLEIEDSACNDANHPHAVDLGLSVKWACCNVGANSPEEYGDYFAWGETSPKEKYYSSTYQHWTDLNGNGWLDDGESTITSDISGSQYDAATVNWGCDWRMPTKAEQQELVTACTWTWTSLNGVNGIEVTGPNGNSIFLPAAGFRDTSSGAGSEGSSMYYWSSTPVENNEDRAYDFTSSRDGWLWHNARENGQSIRPVTE